ncbi:hypothetical protein RGQ21_11380 [Kitasatospora aureofaciens]|nr:hypothetical protein RGQ21_11380 [Kitasatospora aureofaciens]
MDTLDGCWSQPFADGRYEDGRLIADRWLVVPPGSSRVLMGAAHRGIDARIPHGRTLRTGRGLEPAEDPMPGAVSLAIGGTSRRSGPTVRTRRARLATERPFGPGTVDQLPPGPDRRPRRADVSGRLVYGEVDSWGLRRTSRVISLGAKIRNGGPQKPVPRLV